MSSTADDFSRRTQGNADNARPGTASEKRDTDPFGGTTGKNDDFTADNLKPIGRIDHYELLKELGTGGFGSVYLARDTASRTFVAVKGLPQLVKDSEDEMERIRENFVLAARLKHPNIAAALVLHPAQSASYADAEAERKLNVKPGNTMLVMDYAPGVPLSKWVRQFKGRQVPLDKAIEMTRQIATALDYSHSQKVIHRDVKPANVMVETHPDGTFTARVLDFGLAAEVRSSMNRVSQQGVTDKSGTLQYMSPEQWGGKRQNAASDQYALAALFYELVTGDVPFASVFDCGDKEIMLATVTKQPPEIPSKLPKAVRRTLVRGLAKTPEERYATCGDFVASLDGKKVFGHFVSPDSQNLGRKLTVAVLAGLAAVCLGGALYWMYDRYRQDQERRLTELRRQADLLESRAEQARKSVRDLHYADEPDLALACKRLEGYFLAAEKAKKAGDLVSATNRYELVGECKRQLDRQKSKLDEARRRREHDRKVADLVGRGYVREVGADGVTNAVWKAGQRHPVCADLVSEEKPETWRSSKIGYEWDGTSGVVWKAGVEHPEHPHWISAKVADQWLPAPGYASNTNGETAVFAPLAWKSGIEANGRRASEREGVWEDKVRCETCGGAGKRSVDGPCPTCKGSCSVEDDEPCSACSGEGSVKREDLCRRCNGIRQVRVECSAGCGQITKSGRVLYRHGFVCRNCSCKGKVSNMGGVVGSFAADLIVSALGGKSNSTASTPTDKICPECSGVGAYLCGTCNGIGYTQASCPDCSGTGRATRSENCVICDGSGRKKVVRRCTVCKNGNVSTSHACESCGGIGQVWQEDAPGKAVHRIESEIALRARKDAERAAERSRQLQEAGDLFRQGQRHRTGNGCEVDLEAAARCLKRSAELGYVKAQYEWAVMCQKGEGVPADEQAAKGWYDKALVALRTAAEQGDADAMNSLGLMLENGRGVAKDLTGAAKWYRQAAEKGNADAQYNLGWMSWTGRGVKADVAEARQWLTLSANQGNADAQNAMGRMCEAGAGAERNMTEAIKWYRLAAEQNLAVAMNNLGMCYLNGSGVEKDETEALRLFRLAAERGDAFGQNNLGNAYQNGYGVAKDVKEAEKWYLKSAEQGNANAMHNLGVMFEDGDGGRKDLAEATRWYRKAAELGNGSAMTAMGRMYEFGNDEMKDLAEAERWYRKAAEKGDSYGQYFLGVMYAQGKGVAKDYSEAFKWYLKSAKQGNKHAQNNLAVLYDDGLGVQQNEAEALKWYRAAARQGNQTAQKALRKRNLTW